MLNATVLPLSRYRPTPSAPLFIFVDLQKEFTLEGRPLQICNLEGALSNCHRLLQLARTERFPIAHVRLTRSSVTFHQGAGGAEWIDNFKPRGAEMIFEREQPSCYTSSAFKQMMDEGGGAAAFLAGLAGSTSCLTTLIDAHRCNHHIKFAFDASSSHAFPATNEASVHEAAVRMAAQFVELMRTDEVIAQFRKSTSRQKN